MIAKRGQLQREWNGASGGSASAVRRGAGGSADRTLKRALLQPRHPERICWGCDNYCGADELACGNGTIRTPHPLELFGEDWAEWSGALDVAVRLKADTDAS